MQPAIYQNCKLCGGDTVAFLPQFNVNKCTTCSFIFYKYPLDTAFVKALYHQLYNQQNDYVFYKQQAALLQQGKQPHLGYNKLKVLHSLLSKRCKNIVEIGAGVGIVGNYLQHKKLNYRGIELDAGAAQLAQSAGVQVMNASFRSIADFTNQDAVIAFEVLEHIDDVKECLELMYKCLKPGGYIGFSVPNFKIFYNQNAEQQLKSMGQTGPPVHINFFTVENLQYILSQFHFQPIYLQPRPYPTLLWKRKATYKKLWQALWGKYEGSVLLGVARREG